MSKIISKGYTDTPISGVTALELNRGLVNFGADFRVKSNNPGEAVVTNITSPTDRPESFKFGVKANPNLYKNSGINPALQAPFLNGIDLVVGLKEVWSVTDTTDASYRYDLPLSGHLVLNVPADDMVTANDLILFIGRLVSGLYETGSEASLGLNRLIRGALLPADL